MVMIIGASHRRHILLGRIAWLPVRFSSNNNNNNNNNNKYNESYVVKNEN